MKNKVDLYTAVRDSYAIMNDSNYLHDCNGKLCIIQSFNKIFEGYYFLICSLENREWIEIGDVIYELLIESYDWYDQIVNCNIEWVDEEEQLNEFIEEKVDDIKDLLELFLVRKKIKPDKEYNLSYIFWLINKISIN